MLSLVIILTAAGVSVNNPFYCYSEDPHKPQIAMYSINTPYEIIRGRGINANVSTCSPSKFWMLSRYGTRLPNLDETTNILSSYSRLHSEILDNYDQGKTSLCAADIELLKNWSIDPNITIENILHLTPTGWDEFKRLAQRYQSAFPSLLPSTYSENYYFLRSAGLDMSERSLHAFADGLFGAGGHEQVRFEEIPERDYLLLPYDYCPLYQEVTAAREEPEAFREGPEYQEMTLQVSAKLGFHGSRVLRNSEIDIFASLCKYEQIWYMNKTSAYCGGFSVANHQVDEYYWELETYYRFGYGFSNYRRLFENMNCFLMQDMLRFLQSNDVNDHKAKVFNTYNSAFSMFFLHFGVYEDDTPLTRHNFAQQTNRLWKTSLIGPTAANLALIRYE